jgi:hypothetical protein
MTSESKDRQVTAKSNWTGVASPDNMRSAPKKHTDKRTISAGWLVEYQNFQYASNYTLGYSLGYAMLLAKYIPPGHSKT